MISYNTLFLLFLAAFLLGLWIGMTVAVCAFERDADYAESQQPQTVDGA